jgi:hypothetical protein
MRRHHYSFEIHQPVPITMRQQTSSIFRAAEKIKEKGAFYWLSIQAPNLCLLFLCHYVDLQKDTQPGLPGILHLLSNA